MNGGYKDIYRVIFGTAQFPYWFTAQAIYACYAVKKSFARKPRTFSFFMRKLLLSFAMTFTSREIFAFTFKKLSPLQHNPITAGIFLLVFLLMNSTPFDAVYKLTGFLFYFVGLAQGFNQTRYFTLIIRNIKKYKEFAGPRVLPVAIGFAVLDNAIELFLRPLLGGEETRVTNASLIFRSAIVMVVFWVSTNYNYFTQWIGIYNARTKT